MTTARFDGTAIAPAARLRAAWPSRRAMTRCASGREALGRRGVSCLLLDDAGLAVLGRCRAELERLTFRPL